MVTLPDYQKQAPKPVVPVSAPNVAEALVSKINNSSNSESEKTEAVRQLAQLAKGKDFVALAGLTGIACNLGQDYGIWSEAIYGLKECVVASGGRGPVTDMAHNALTDLLSSRQLQDFKLARVIDALWAVPESPRAAFLLREIIVRENNSSSDLCTMAIDVLKAEIGSASTEVLLDLAKADRSSGFGRASSIFTSFKNRIPNSLIADEVARVASDITLPQQIRGFALDALSGSRDDQADLRLVDLLDTNKDREIEDKIILALSGTRSQAVIRKLVDKVLAAKGPYLTSGQAIAIAILSVAKLGEEPSRDLLKFIQESYKKNPGFTEKCLAPVLRGTTDPSTLRQLMKWLNRITTITLGRECLCGTDESLVVGELLRTLKREESKLGRLINAITGKDCLYRMTALRVLTNAGMHTAIPLAQDVARVIFRVVRTLHDDRSPDVRARAATILAAFESARENHPIFTSKAVAALIESVQRDPSNQVRLVAGSVLSSFAKEYSQIDQVLRDAQPSPTDPDRHDFERRFRDFREERDRKIGRRK